MRHIIRRALLAALAALAAASAPAYAQVESSVKMVEMPPGDDGKVPTPIFRGRVKVPIPGLASKDFVLKEIDSKPPVQSTASKVVTYKDSDEPMAMIILVQGNFRWIGNETYNDPEASGDSSYVGTYTALAPAIEALAKAGPPGSQAAVVIYTQSQAIEKAPMGPADQLSGAVLGNQESFQDNIGRPLDVGLKDAYTRLTKIQDHRRILVVIGDGNGDKEDITEDLRPITIDLKKTDIEVYAIHFSNAEGEGPQGLGNMKKVGKDGTDAATSKDNIKTFAEAIANKIGARYYVDFPSDEFIKAGLMDGKEHNLVVSVKGEDAEPFLVQVPVIAPPSKDEGMSLWWLWIVIPLLLIVGIVVAVIKFGKKEVVEAPVEEVAPPPPPPGPSKTVMLGMGGGDDSMPVVGWIVPITGVNQFQTFKLLSGKTIVGTGGTAHVVVQDHFMSTEHAQVVSSPSGFVLQDNGSTNGVYVNSRKVSTHELVDNDVFTLGKTDFKFKSIN